MSLTLVGLCGSLRKGSFNRKLMREAARRFGPETFVEADLNLPLYDGDREAEDGIPEPVQTLSDQIAAADAALVVSPEYNQSISGVMKNALDWISRTDGTPWFNKPVALMTAAAGRAGGARAQYALRLCMAPFRPHVIAGPELLLARPASEFDDEGKLTSELYGATLDELMGELRKAAEAHR